MRIYLRSKFQTTKYQDKFFDGILFQVADMEVVDLAVDLGADMTQVAMIIIALAVTAIVYHLVSVAGKYSSNLQRADCWRICLERECKKSRAFYINFYIYRFV